MQVVKGRYRHYKGNEYLVLGLARHSETEEWMVYYQALYGEMGFWVRPLSLFMEPVVDVHGSRQPRFRLLEPLIEEPHG